MKERLASLGSQDRSSLWLRNGVMVFQHVKLLCLLRVEFFLQNSSSGRGFSLREQNLVLCSHTPIAASPSSIRRSCSGVILQVNDRTQAKLESSHLDPPGIQEWIVKLVLGFSLCISFWLKIHFGFSQGKEVNIFQHPCFSIFISLSPHRLMYSHVEINPHFDWQEDTGRPFILPS